jgi:hypothetical protein
VVENNRINCCGLTGFMVILIAQKDNRDELS